MTDLSALIERIEAGSGEDSHETRWELAGDIARIVFGPQFSLSQHYEIHDAARSLDAALAFAEAVGVRWRIVLLTGMDECNDLGLLPRRVLIATLKALQAKDTP